MNKRAFLALAAILAACNPAPAPTTSQPVPIDLAPFIARQRVHADEEMAALVRGQLTVLDGCVRITSPVGNPGRLVVWPVETVADASTGAVRIRNTANDSDVGVGDMVEMSGGEASALDPNSLAEPIPATCRGPYWIAGSHWRALPAQ
jgi:hypothetical protein